MVRLGLGSWIALGTVSGYTTDGTQSDTELYLRVEGGSLSPQYERDRLEMDNLDTVDHQSSLVRGGQERVGGTISFRVAYGDLADLIRIITGHNVSPSGGGGVFDDDFDMQAPNASAHYLLGSTKRHIVMEVNANDSGGNAIFYQGLLITNAQLVFDQNSLAVMCTLTFLGARQTRGTKSASPSYSTDWMATPTGQAALLFTLDGTSRRANSVTVTIDMPMEHRYDVIDKAPSTHPLPSGKRVVTVEADIEFPDTDATLLSALEDPVANKFTGTNTVQVTDAASRDLLVTFGDLYINPPADPRPEGIGVLRAALSLVSKDDGTDDDVKFHVKSDATAYRIT